MKHSLKQLYLISKNTFNEVLQAKVLLNIGFIAAALVLVTFIATRFTFGVPSRVAIDVGLGLLTISSVVIALSLGVGLLSNEINSRTIYVVLSRSVSREVFIFGKFIGLFLILVVNVLIIGLSTLVCFKLLGGELNNLIFWSIFFVILESGVVLSLAIFLSLLVSKSLASIVTISLWIIGHGIDSAINTLFAKASEWIMAMLKIYKILLPSFYKLNIKDYVLYQQEVPTETLIHGIFYGTTYSLAIILLSSIIFQYKNFD